MEQLVKDYYLTHHGIRGQKWGVRNGPPYPLAPSAHSASEKKAGWQSSLNKHEKALSNHKVNGATEAAVGIGIILFSTVAEYSILGLMSMLHKKQEERRLKQEKLLADTLKKNGGDALPKKQSPDTVESDMAAVNPKFSGPHRDNGYLMNCMYCTTVYDLRRRGYDVTANRRPDGGGTCYDVTKWYKGAEIEFYDDDVEGALASLKKQPNGSRGNLMGSGLYFGHSLAYEIDNGDVKIYDTQSNETMSWKEFANQYGTSMSFARTDNLEPNWETIGEVIDPKCLKRRKQR